MNWEVASLVLFVFFARLCDVTLATLRHVLVVRGLRGAAAGVALVESLVWVLAISKVLDRADQPAVAGAFALGFAAGTLVGMTVEQHLGLGEQVVRVFSTDGTMLAEKLRAQGYRVTQFEGTGRDGRVDLLFIQVRRRLAVRVAQLVRQLEPGCFCVIDDVRTVEQAK
jgi:uncharacterized protein YebE (UPF0316 family)